MDILEEIHENDPSRYFDISGLCKVSVSQFHGIEIEAFPVEIAKVALWLMDHLCNMEVAERFGQYFVRIPIKDSAHIVCANALTTDWPRTNYIMGNPPFVGFTYMDAAQKADMLSLFPKNKNLDFVCGWYKKASDMIQDAATHCAFVSTNSITQGEQVSALWKNLNVQIDFAYRTFKWRNEAKGVAAVHCVIIGFHSGKSCLSQSGGKDATSTSLHKTIYNSDGMAISAAHINAYLMDAPDVLVESRNKSLCDVPQMVYGNKPTDGGNLIIEADEYESFIAKEPLAAKYIKRLIGAKEFLHNLPRYCLWLKDANPQEIANMPLVRERIRKCREMRLSSKDAGARQLAMTPSLFRETNNPKTAIVIPCTSSENREIIPIDFIDDSVIVTNLVQIIPDATLYHFGILTSRMHMAWMRAVAGRLEMRYRYSKDIVYNNFIWPDLCDSGAPRKRNTTSEMKGVHTDKKSTVS